MGHGHGNIFLRQSKNNSKISQNDINVGLRAIRDQFEQWAHPIGYPARAKRTFHKQPKPILFRTSAEK